jgi:uncharacterized membrane protein
MRSIGLIIACSLLATCGGPRPDNSTGGAEAQEDVAAGDAGGPNEQAEPQPVSQGAGESDEVQAGTVSPCLMQGTERLQVAAIRAVGTEPFWTARVEGRCITYSHPENQQGTRVWTLYTAGPDGLVAWVGHLNGKKFEIRVRPEAGCSDGMSDKRYSLAVELLVDGEQRKGCAEPL